MANSKTVFSRIPADVDDKLEARAAKIRKQRKLTEHQYGKSTLIRDLLSAAVAKDRKPRQRAA